MPFKRKGKVGKARGGRSSTLSFVAPPDASAVHRKDENMVHHKGGSQVSHVDVKVSSKPPVDEVDVNVNRGVLAQFYPFNLLDRQLLLRVEASVKEVEFEPLQVVLEQGDKLDRDVYLIKSGRFEALDVREATDEVRNGAGGRHVAVMIAGTYFGERSSLFSLPRSRQVRCAKGEKGVAYVIAGQVMDELFASHDTAFSLALASKLRLGQGLFDNFLSFTGALASVIDKSGSVDLDDLIAKYRLLTPAIHSGIDSADVDYAAWSYAVRRLPDNITTTYSLLLAPKLVGLLKQDSCNKVVPSESPGRRIEIPERRRTCWELMPGKTFILLRTLRSDLIDIVTLLALHSIEANKLRNMCKPLRDSVPHFQQAIRLMDENPSRAYKIESDALIAYSRFNDVDVRGLATLWRKGDIIKNIVNVCVHHGDFDLRLDTGRDTYMQSADELWMTRLHREAMALIGQFDRSDETLVVDVVSSNTHSFINCLSPYTHKNKDKILSWAKRNKRPELIAAKGLLEHDLLYILVPPFLEANPEEQSELERTYADAGIRLFPEKEMTGVTAQMVDMNKLMDYGAPVDPVLNGLLSKHSDVGWASRRRASKKTNGDGEASDSSNNSNSSGSSTSSAPKRRRHLLLNVDYAFGSQGQHLLRLICLVFGRTLASVNVLGKAGGLVGQRGDILYPTHVLDESQEGAIRTVDNWDLDPDLLSELSRKRVHVGPIITVAGTLLQNQELLKFYERLWHATGMEMEGSWYLQALHQAQQLGILKSNVRSRFVYYVSDLPLQAASGASLASKMTLAEGVPSLYAITRHVLERIMDHDMNKSVNIIDSTAVAKKRVVMDAKVEAGEQADVLESREGVNGEEGAGARRWRTVNHVMRAVHRTTVAANKTDE